MLSRPSETIVFSRGICVGAMGGWVRPRCSAPASILLVKEPLPSWFHIKNHGENVFRPLFKYCFSSAHNMLNIVQYWHLGGFLTHLISLKTKFWSSCQSYQHPMESLLTCIFWVHQYVCHFLPGNGFSHPRCKCVICDVSPASFYIPLPGARAENMIQLREIIQYVAVEVIFQKSLFLCV